MNDPTRTGVGVIDQPKSKRDETPKYLEKFEKEVEKHKSKLFSDNSPPYNLLIPFLQRLQKHKLDGQFAKFLEIFKKLQINIPFVDALAQMPSHERFMKLVLSKKKKLEDYETVALTEQCSAILHKKVPPKLKDPGSFHIPCTIGTCTFDKA